MVAWMRRCVGGKALSALILAVILGAVVAVLSASPRTASAEIVQGGVVPEEVRRDTPIVLDGRVTAQARVGDRIFVGGDFQQVQLQDGSVVDQAHIFAYDIDTGELDQNFRPILNNSVDALETNNAGDGLYVGGRFFRWETDAGVAFPLRIAKLAIDGTLDSSFDAAASARVLSIEQIGDDLYLGGDFLEVSGIPIAGLARVDATTGDVDSDFDLELNSSILGPQLVRRVIAHPNGEELFVMHYNEQVLGELRQAVFKLDVSEPTPVLSDWEISLTDQTDFGLCWAAMRDMAISPDGSFIVIGGQGGDRPPNCDSVLRYETAAESLITFTWSARMYSSIFSLAVSDAAVYVGGHFCAAPRLGAVYEGGLTSDFPGIINPCNVGDPEDPENPSNVDPVNATFRNQLAALDPETAQALDWDPGSNNSVGVFDLTLIDRGLLAGHDGDRFNEFLVGRAGFFDFGVPDDNEAPTISVAQPVAGAIDDSVTTISGFASDNRAVTGVTIRLRNITTQEWLQLDGSLGQDQVDLPVTVVDAGIGEVSWSVAVSDLPAGDYEVRGFASDAVGLTSLPLAHRFIVPGDAQCTVELNELDQPVITYAGFLADDQPSVFVRRDGGFLASTPPGSGVFVDETAAPGERSYLLRWRPDGVVTDVECTPEVVTVPEGGGELICTAGLDEDGNPQLAWSEVPGVSTYVVREEVLGFVATVTVANAQENVFTDTGRAAGDYSYSIRYRVGGVPIDRDCSPAPITVEPGDPVVNTCTATVTNDGTVELVWSEIPGEDLYQVRDDDGFVATAVPGELSFEDANPTSGIRTYVIRSRQNSVTTDVTCNEVTVP